MTARPFFLPSSFEAQAVALVADVLIIAGGSSRGFQHFHSDLRQKVFFWGGV